MKLRIVGTTTVTSWINSTWRLMPSTRMDKDVDFEALSRIDEEGGFFVTRAKGNMKYEIITGNFNIDEQTGLRGDHSIRLTGYKSSKLHPKKLRLVEYSDIESGEKLLFITNMYDCLELNGLEIAEIYRHR